MGNLEISEKFVYLNEGKFMLPESKIKDKLINTIRDMKDEELLLQISRLVDLDLQIEDVYQFNAEELKAVNEGLEQLDRGEFVSNEESNRRAAEWLKR